MTPMIGDGVPAAEVQGAAAVAVLIARIERGQENAGDGLRDEDLVRAAALPAAQREQFLAGRRLLRAALAAGYGPTAATTSIRTGPTGKPFLPRGLPAISLAHSGPWCALALSEDCEVGVDIEQIVDRPGLESLTATFLPPLAREEIAAARAERSSEIVLRWWVRIEAAAKALGAPLEHAARCLDAVQLADWQIPAAVAAVAGRSARRLAVTWTIDASRGSPRS